MKPRDQAFQQFLQRVWRDDVRPLLAASHPQTRAASARGVAKAGAAFGLLLDGALRLRGKPFTRALTTFGGQIGAMLPDAFDWRWFGTAPRESREQVAERLVHQASALELAEACALLGVSIDVGDDDLRRAWHEAAARWHPDRATNEQERDEFHLRFVALQAAYERIRAARASKLQ
ncbi:MAG: J domain-containing protein [Phycisphaerae bacterium]|nr:J domain-containing protein [Phycisphaerae bacterium]